MRYTYTNEDIEFLKNHYPNAEWDLIEKRFPKLNKSSIYTKCQRIGIKSNNTHRKIFDNSKTRKMWNNKEIEILKNNYSKMSLDNVCKLLPNRNKNMILCKAKNLRLISYEKNKQTWKENEIQYIIKNWELIPDKIMAKTLNRTFRSVKYKREELGLYRQNKDNSSYFTLSKYLRGQNQKWKKESMKSCDYKCVLTESKNFEIHHLYSMSNIIKDMLNKHTKLKDKSFSDYTKEDLSFLLGEFLKEQNKYPLGVCVDKKIHSLFHSMYGQYYNTPQQWEQFYKDYKDGVYKEYI